MFSANYGRVGMAVFSIDGENANLTEHFVASVLPQVRRVSSLA